MVEERFAVFGTEISALLELYDMPPDLPVGFDELGVDGLDGPNPAVGVGVGNLVQQVPVGVGLQFTGSTGSPPDTRIRGRFSTFPRNRTKSGRMFSTRPTADSGLPARAGKMPRWRARGNRLTEILSIAWREDNISKSLVPAAGRRTQRCSHFFPRQFSWAPHETTKWYCLWEMPC